MIIYQTRSGCVIEFDRGKFDDWCVYLARNGKSRYAPRDPEYFEFLRQAALHHTAEKVYRAFLAVFNVTGKSVNPEAALAIKEVSLAFGTQSDEMEVWLAVMWGGMIAEENKAFTMLGKRIKHLGVHQVLMQGISVTTAANWSRGKKWREIAAECQLWKM